MKIDEQSPKNLNLARIIINGKLMTEDKNLRWKILDSDYLHKDRWLTVRSDKVELPDGKTLYPYYVLEYCDWINVLAITKEKKFVFVRQYRHGAGQVDFELCAGFIDSSDSSPLHAAQRELLEETGYGKGKWSEFTRLSANPSTHNNITYCYLAEDVEKIDEQQLDESEFISVHLFSVDEVRELLDNDQIRQSLMAAALWKYIAKNKL